MNNKCPLFARSLSVPEPQPGIEKEQFSREAVRRRASGLSFRSWSKCTAALGHAPPSSITLRPLTTAYIRIHHDRHQKPGGPQRGAFGMSTSTGHTTDIPRAYHGHTTDIPRDIVRTSYGHRTDMTDIVRKSHRHRTFRFFF